MKKKYYKKIEFWLFIASVIFLASYFNYAYNYNEIGKMAIILFIVFHVIFLLISAFFIKVSETNLVKKLYPTIVTLILLWISYTFHDIDYYSDYYSDRPNITDEHWYANRNEGLPIILISIILQLTGNIISYANLNDKICSYIKKINTPNYENIDNEEIINKEPSVDIPLSCPHCKSPNTNKTMDCEWCGNPMI